METASNDHGRTPRPGALASIVFGAVLGALVLGSGGRLAMRGITLWEHRMHLFSVQGTVTVLLWGAAFGAVAGGVRAALEAGFDRWAPAAPRQARLTSFVLLSLGAALVVLTPWTVRRLVLFPIVVIVFLAGFEALWRSLARRHTVRQVAQPDIAFGGDA